VRSCHENQFVERQAEHPALVCFQNARRTEHGWTSRVLKF
jgi:hypothetical protein